MFIKIELRNLEVSIKTLDDYGFLLCFIGGILTVVTALLMFIVSVSGGRIHWFFGAGYIGIASEIAGSIVSIIFGTLAMLIGLKLFSRKIWEVITKIDSYNHSNSNDCNKCNCFWYRRINNSCRRNFSLNLSVNARRNS